MTEQPKPCPFEAWWAGTGWVEPHAKNLARAAWYKSRGGALEHLREIVRRFNAPAGSNPTYLDSVVHAIARAGEWLAAHHGEQEQPELAEETSGTERRDSPDSETDGARRALHGHGHPKGGREGDLPGSVSGVAADAETEGGVRSGESGQLGHLEQGRVAQLEEHRVFTPMAAGSIPVAPTKQADQETSVVEPGSARGSSAPPPGRHPIEHNIPLGDCPGCGQSCDDDGPSVEHRESFGEMRMACPCGVSSGWALDFVSCYREWNRISCDAGRAASPDTTDEPLGGPRPEDFQATYPEDEEGINIMLKPRPLQLWEVVITFEGGEPDGPYLARGRTARSVAMRVRPQNGEVQVRPFGGEVFAAADLREES